jgi:putative ABC transport system permease protein
LRELRGGLAGLRILAVCLVLGVAALAGVGSLASAINAGLAERGQFLMGGDAALRVSGRNPTPEQRAAAAALGTVGDVVKLRGMVSRGDGGDSVLAEVKAVDATWPLYGRVALEGGGRVGPGMAAAQPVLADKLGLKPGDRLQLGQATLTYAGTLLEEPDRAGDGFGFGPGLVVDVKDLERAELITLGSLYTSELRVKLKPGVFGGSEVMREPPRCARRRSRRGSTPKRRRRTCASSACRPRNGIGFFSFTKAPRPATSGE